MKFRVYDVAPEQEEEVFLKLVSVASNRVQLEACDKRGKRLAAGILGTFVNGEFVRAGHVKVPGIKVDSSKKLSVV